MKNLEDEACLAKNYFCSFDFYYTSLHLTAARRSSISVFLTRSWNSLDRQYCAMSVGKAIKDAIFQFQ